MTTASELAAWFLAQVGKPYVLGQPIPHNTKNPKKLDCSGLFICGMNNLGHPMGDTTAQGLFLMSKAVTNGKYRPGDMVFLANHSGRSVPAELKGRFSKGIGHVAVLTRPLSNGDWEIVEAKGRAYGVVRATLSFWRTRGGFCGVRRWPKLTVTTDPKEPEKPAESNVVVPKATLTADGVWGKLTTQATCWALGCKTKHSTLTLALRKFVQGKLGVKKDGIWGPLTIKALQKSCGARQTGKLDKTTIKAWQKWLNVRIKTQLDKDKKATETPKAVQGRILAAVSKNKAWGSDGTTLTALDGWRGSRFVWFAKKIEEWFGGVVLSFQPISVVIPQAGHAFVVLGSTVAKMRRRLEAALPTIKANPHSKVVVSGAPLRDSGGVKVTEAQYMRSWLIAQGVAADRILVEGKASSTVGNATYSVALMQSKGITTYTLCSDASHLRRALVEFHAARVKDELKAGKTIALEPVHLIAFNDYSPNPVKPTKAIDTTTRANIMAEVVAMLDLVTEYKAAL